MNPDIIAGLVYEHTSVGPIVFQRLDERNTLLVLQKVKILRNYVKSCSLLKYGWVAVYTLDVMLPHLNR